MSGPVPDGGPPAPDRRSPGNLVRVALRSTAPRLAVAQVFAGVSAYGFLVLSGRALGPEKFASVSVLWSSLFLLGSGLFQPLEQEMSRRVSHQRELGQGTRALVVGAARVSTALVAAVLVLMVAAGPWAVPTLFHDEPLTYVGLLVGVAGIAASHFLRGIAAGQGRFGAYGAWFVAEGLTNLVPTVVLVVLAVQVAGLYGLVAGMAGVVAAAVTGLGLERDHEPGPAFAPKEYTAKVGQLAVASALLALLISGGPIAVKLLAEPGDDAAVSHFLAGLTVVRIPLYFFQTVQAVVLPRLTRQAARHDYPAFRRGLRGLLAALAAVGVVATAGSALLGPFVVRLMFGASFDELTGLDLGLLAAGGCVLMGAMLVSQAPIALQNQARVWVGWAVGVAAAVATAAVPCSLFLRVELSLLAGSAASMATMWALYVVTVRSREQDAPATSTPVYDPAQPDDAPGTARD